METVVWTLSSKEEKLMKVLDFAEIENFVCTVQITNVHTYAIEDDHMMIRQRTNLYYGYDVSRERTDVARAVH